MTPTIIALAGPKGVGKTTVANALLSNPNIKQPVGILPFAGGLKKMLQAILPPEAFKPDGKEDPAYGLLGKTPRHLMQTLGTEWGRKLVGENVWVEVMIHQIQQSGLATVIIDDLRFENEWQMVKNLGGTVIALERNGCSYSSEHASERGLDPHLFDQVINLDKTDPKHLNP